MMAKPMAKITKIIYTNKKRAGVILPRLLYFLVPFHSVPKNGGLYSLMCLNTPFPFFPRHASLKDSSYMWHLIPALAPYLLRPYL